MRNDHKPSDDVPASPGSRTSNDALNETLQTFLKLYGDTAAKEGVSPALSDAFAQALVAIVGPSPGIAEMADAFAAQQAAGIMMQNAVANQQKTNILGMAMTAKCVRYLLDPKAPLDFDADPDAPKT